MPFLLAAVSAMGFRALAAPIANVEKHRGQPYQLEAIRAYLYYQQSGTFEDRGLVPDKTGFVNVMIGGGGAREPSGAIVVLVDISGPKFGQSLPSSAVLSVKTEGKNRPSATTRIPCGVFTLA
jgi:hypothetical protein